MKVITSIGVFLNLNNVDTDMIIPKQFLKIITRIGLGKYLFYEKRYDKSDNFNKDFILNQSPFDKSEILISGENFGCGSSREHAVWALKDFGIKVIIAKSFADIFYNNCFENMILPIVLNQENIEKIKLKEISIDIEKQIITCDDNEIHFDLDKTKKHKIINNIDAITETLLKIEKIKAFENKNNSSS